MIYNNNVLYCKALYLLYDADAFHFRSLIHVPSSMEPLEYNLMG